jgi:transposase
MSLRGVDCAWLLIRATRWRHARNRPTRDGEWVRALLARKPTKLAAVALANKTARIVWAVMMRADGYRAKEVLGLPA